MFKRLKNIENVQKNLISGSDNESIYYTPKSQFDSERDKGEDKKTTIKEQHRHKTNKCLWLFKNFKSRGKRFDGWNRRRKQGHQRKKACFY